MTELAQIRVMIVDNHAMVRQGLSVLFKALSGFVTAGQARDGEEAIQLYETLLPDVVLMDLNMPGMNGIEATRAIRQRYPNAKIVVLTSSTQEDPMVKAALAAGAVGYLHKQVSIDDLAKTLQQAVSVG